MTKVRFTQTQLNFIASVLCKGEVVPSQLTDDEIIGVGELLWADEDHLVWEASTVWLCETPNEWAFAERTARRSIKSAGKKLDALLAQRHSPTIY